MHTFGNVLFGLFEYFSGQDDGGCGSVSGDFVLCGGRASNQGGRRMLNLHLFQQRQAVFSEFELPRSSDQQFQRSRRTQIRRNDVLQSNRRRYVHP